MKQIKDFPDVTTLQLDDLLALSSRMQRLLTESVGLLAAIPKLTQDSRLLTAEISRRQTPNV